MHETNLNNFPSSFTKSDEKTPKNLGKYVATAVIKMAK
jgi:hypothetical protein